MRVRHVGATLSEYVKGSLKIKWNPFYLSITFWLFWSLGCFLIKVQNFFVRCVWFLVSCNQPITALTDLGFEYR